jgi:thymidylate synthase ThyX
LFLDWWVGAWAAALAALADHAGPATAASTATSAAHRNRPLTAVKSDGRGGENVPMRVAEPFSEQERARLAPFVTDLDAPVFALRGLPETTRGALFARYSRYRGTLRRLLLDEFDAELDARAPAAPDGRAQELYERVLGEYGDDSVAQLGGLHVACEWVSNLMTKVLERPRLGAFLEQSTRYIAFDEPVPGLGYRYHREAELGEAYESDMDALFEAYGEALAVLRPWLAERFPREPEASERAHERAVRAKALDLARSLLPAATLSHVGIFASGQTFERLVLRLRAEELPEARRCAEEMLGALRAVAPAFMSRVDRSERGGTWTEFLRRRAAAETLAAGQLGVRRPPGEAGGSVRLLAVEGDERRLLTALVFERAAVSEERIEAAVAALDAEERGELLGELLGGRDNRRHLPGRGLEALRYRFEIVSDYGAFRDLQRHRMLTAQWQPLGPHLGPSLPEQARAAGLDELFERAFERSTAAWQRLADAGLHAQAPYALCLAFRIRYVLDMNAREAMHLIELRSGREGHESYRTIAQGMHRLIAGVHPAVAAAMTHLDTTSAPRLERIEAELRGESRGGRHGAPADPS